jgi:hypothetical protein
MSTTEQPLSLDLKSLTEVLIRHFDLHEGVYQLNLGFKIGVGGFAMDGAPGATLPGAVLGVEGAFLVKIPQGRTVPNAVDAASVLAPVKRKPRSRPHKP